MVNLGQTLFRLGFQNGIPNYKSLQLTIATGFIGLWIVSTGDLLRKRTGTFRLNRRGEFLYQLKDYLFFEEDFPPWSKLLKNYNYRWCRHFCWAFVWGDFSDTGYHLHHTILPFNFFTTDLRTPVSSVPLEFSQHFFLRTFFQEKKMVKGEGDVLKKNCNEKLENRKVVRRICTVYAALLVPN
jgi:hypothetical protein